METPSTLDYSGIVDKIQQKQKFKNLSQNFDNIKIFPKKTKTSSDTAKKINKNWITPEKLREIRNSIKNSDKLLAALELKIDHEDTTHYWLKSPFREETESSFHIEKSGDLRWYDFGG